MKSFFDKLMSETTFKEKVMLSFATIILVVVFCVILSSVASARSWVMDAVPENVEPNGQVTKVIPFFGFCREVQDMRDIMSASVDTQEVLEDGRCYVVPGGVPIFIDPATIDLEDAELVVNVHRNVNVYIVEFEFNDEIWYSWVPDFVVAE